MTSGGFRAIDRVQLRALLRAYFRMTARGVSLVRNRDGMPTSLTLVLIMYVVIGLLLGLMAFEHLDTFAYALLIDWMTFLTLGMAAVVEANEVLFDPKEDEILLHRPIHPSTLLAAKGLALVGFTSALAAALSLFPAFFGLASSDAKPWFPLVHVASTALLVVFCCALVVCTYGVVLRLLGRERFGNFAAYAQLGMVFVFIGGFQVLPHLVARHGENVDAHKFLDYMLITPPGWFAAFDATLAGGASTRELWLCAGLAVFSTVVLSWLAVGKLSTGYSDITPSRSNVEGTEDTASSTREHSSSTRRRAGNPVTRWWLRDPVERGAFGLACAYMRRDREVKSRLYSGLSGFAMFIVLQVMDWDDPDSSFPSLMMVALAGTLPMLVIEALRVSSHHAASEVFQYAPLSSPAALFHGIRKASIVFIQVPMLVFAAAMLLLKPGADLSIFELALPIVIVLPTLSLIPGAFGVFLPLSTPPRRGQQSSRNVTVSVMLMFVMLVPAGLGYIARELGVLWPTLGVELVALVIVHRWLTRLIAQRPTRSIME